MHRVFLGDYVKIYDASDPNLYMVTGVTWFPLTAKKRRAEPPTPVLFSPSRPLLRTQCELSFAGARGGPRRSLTKAFNKTECMPVAGCALQADLCPPPHPHPSGPPRGTQCSRARVAGSPRFSEAGDVPARGRGEVALPQAESVSRQRPPRAREYSSNRL